MKSLGVGLAVGALLVTVTVVPASADPGPMPNPQGADGMAAEARDVTDSDTALGDVSREVVVVTDTPAGPEITKVQAPTQAVADTVTETLDEIPGMVAEENTALRLQSSDAGTAASTPRSARSRRGGVRYEVSRTPTAAGETFAAKQWGLGVIGAEKAWAVTRGKGSLIAVVDSGVDATHPDLNGRVLPQVNIVPDGRSGDVAGHGTHVTGIIAAELDRAGTVGVANEVQILPVRILNGKGWADAATAAQGVIAAAKAGADVINLSVGSSTSSKALQKAVLFAQSKGALVVAAAGNEGLLGNPVEYPAAYPHVVAVSSMEASGRVSSFANTGTYVDLIAPGAHIFSTLPDGQYGYESGTSMAAPHVSAVAGLVHAANPGLSAQEIEGILDRTAKDDTSGNGRDTSGGFGLVQADAAVTYAAQLQGGLIGPVATSRTRAAKAAWHVSPSGKQVLTARLRTRYTDGSWRKSAVSTSVQVQQRAGGGWTTVTTLTIQKPGRVRAALAPESSGKYRLLVGTSGTVVKLPLL